MNGYELLQERLRILKLYLQQCVDAGDYHGCRDCACDIEITIARMKERHWLTGQGAPEPSP